ncbi:ATPase domain-containing protein (plasmid) [Rhizobium etli 8C-3]|uniref:ATPase domain-containing protein n=1 Tax=Rhizobium etli 8C-3 TaxID=538025 RepID=A0A1L5PEQ9_RHIET|nr:ATPase domain-containing protein [Rhizobium etli 8C-3]
MAITACPCALDLATPMSIINATVHGAQEDVLIQDAEALERFSKVDCIDPRQTLGVPVAAGVF